MTLYQRIEQRVALPGDSETQRAQKTLAVIVLSVSSLATPANGLRYRSQGLADVAALYLLLTGVTLLALLLLLWRPRLYRPLAVAVLSLSMALNTGAHLLAGGYTSGLQIIQWTISVLVFAVILIEPRQTLFLAGVFVVMILTAGILEPRVVDRVPDLDAGFVAMDATTTMLLMGLLVGAAGLMQFGQVERYRRRANDLLLNVLPGSIAQQLKEDPGTIADGYEEVTVLFADIVDFTPMASGADPVAVVNKLNDIFSDFDELAAQHGLEKIKTIGDAYMVAAGLPQARADHCRAVAAFGLDMLAAIENHRSWDGRALALRVGMNTGPVVAGVIGRQKFIFDLWGDAVNVASRMESSGIAGRIQVTAAVKEKLEGVYAFEERGPIAVKGKGEMVTYMLLGREA